MDARMAGGDDVRLGERLDMFDPPGTAPGRRGGVRGAGGGDGRLGERLDMFDPSGTLPERAAEIWELVAPQREAIARAYWERYSRSPEVKRTIDTAKMEELV